jgi:hypothetical protein
MMNGLEFINITDNGQREKILKSIVLDFFAAKYCKIPDMKSLYAKMGDLITSFGYENADINEIAREAAEILGCRLKK